MLHCVYFLFALLLSAALNASDSADDTVKLVTFPIPLMVENQQEGLFIELARAIGKEAGVKIDIEVWPTPRAIKKFQEGDFDVLFPGLDALFEYPEDYLASKELLYIKQDFVFTLRSRPLLTRVDALSGLTLGLTRSYPYAKAITQNPDIHILYVNTDEQNAMMLDRNRIDAFIVEESSGLQAFRKAGIEHKVHYDPSQPVSRQDVYYAFHRTELGRKLERDFSRALLSLKQSGQFDAIMSGAMHTGLEPLAQPEGTQGTAHPAEQCASDCIESTKDVAQ